MSYLLPHLHSGWAVDQAILAEEERAVVIRFGHDWDETCMQVLVAWLILLIFFLGLFVHRPLLLQFLWQNLPLVVRIFRLWLSMVPLCHALIMGKFWLSLGANLQMDEVLVSVAETIKNFAVIYLVDISEVPDFNTMYELYDPCTIMFFFRNKHIMIDLGTGNNNKINWALKNKQEFIDIVETVYRGARKGRGLVVSPKDYSTKYRYWGSENNASSSKTVSFNLVTIMMEELLKLSVWDGNRYTSFLGLLLCCRISLFQFTVCKIFKVDFLLRSICVSKLFD